MDRYLLSEILDYRDYLEWRKLISQVNKEYHHEFYYGCVRYSSIECLRCRNCDLELWNHRCRNCDLELWNHRSYRIYQIRKMRPDCYDVFYIRKMNDEFNCYDGNLPKNY